MQLRKWPELARKIFVTLLIVWPIQVIEAVVTVLILAKEISSLVEELNFVIMKQEFSVKQELVILIELKVVLLMVILPKEVD